MISIEEVIEGAQYTDKAIWREVAEARAMADAANDDTLALLYFLAKQSLWIKNLESTLGTISQLIEAGACEG